MLGSWDAFPEPGRACSGFAVDWDGYHLVLDLGYATLPRLLTHWPDGVADAVAITHEHPDHCIDLHGLFRMRLYGPPLSCGCRCTAPRASSTASQDWNGRGPDCGLRPASAARHLPGGTVQTLRAEEPWLRTMTATATHPTLGARRPAF